MGIFDDQVDLFTTYRAEIQFREKVMGGTPKDPKIALGWIKARMGVDELERQRLLLLETMQETGLLNDKTPEQIRSLTFEQVEDLAEKLGELRQVNGFKFDDNGLYLESRVVKAMMKEVVNILYAGDQWGPTRKGPKAMVAERIFVHPDRVYLGASSPSGIDTFVGHVTGPQGPRSTLTRYEYVYQPRVCFDVMVAHDFVEAIHWKEMWVLSQENGLGSLRSQGFGPFDIERWDVVKQGNKRIPQPRRLDGAPPKKSTKKKEEDTTEAA